MTFFCRISVWLASTVTWWWSNWSLTGLLLVFHHPVFSNMKHMFPAGRTGPLVALRWWRRPLGLFLCAWALWRNMRATKRRPRPLSSPHSLFSHRKKVRSRGPGATNAFWWGLELIIPTTQLCCSEKRAKKSPEKKRGRSKWREKGRETLRGGREREREQRREGQSEEEREKKRGRETRESKRLRERDSH